MIFVDAETNAQAWLRGRADPPSSVVWWPGTSFVSCDGRFAVNTGPWLRAGGKSVGYFTTVWRREADGSWRWLLDHGGALDRPRPARDRPAVRRAPCRGTSEPAQDLPYMNPGSDDRTLTWHWSVTPGERRFTAELWNGRRFEKVIDDLVKTGS